MTERGTTGAGRPEITGVPRVHQFLKLDGRSTTGYNIHLGQTRVGYKSSPVDTTSSDPRQYGGERSESYSLIGRSRGLLDPSEGETEEPSHLGRWRRQKGTDEFQAAVEEERIDKYSPRRDAMLTAIPRAGTLQEVVPLRQRRAGAFSAQRVEALDVNEVSDDELEAEYQEGVALTTILKQRRAGKPQSSGDHKAELDKCKQKLPCAQGRRLGHGKDGHHCLTKVKRVNWAGDSSKLVRELCTVSCLANR